MYCQGHGLCSTYVACLQWYQEGTSRSVDRHVILQWRTWLVESQCGEVYSVSLRWYAHEMHNMCQRHGLNSCFSESCLCLMYKYQGCVLTVSSSWLTMKLAEWYAQLAALVSLQSKVCRVTPIQFLQ